MVTNYKNMLKAYKYRIYPNKTQTEMIEKTFGVCRLVYNLALETKIRAWQSAQKNLTAYDLIYQLPGLKEAYPWIGEVDSQAVQESIKRIEHSFRYFFKGSGFPKFKNKRGPQSFKSTSVTRKVDFEKRTITIPKIKNIKAEISRRFEGKIKSISIVRTSTGKYYASVLVDNEKELPPKLPVKCEKTMGIDMGIKSFVVTSEGYSYEQNQPLKNSLQRLKCLQRRASRKKKGSKNRKKANLCVAILHEKIKNQRVDYCHKITTKLIRDSQMDSFVIENLAIRNMLKNRKLSKIIHDVAFGEFFRQIGYKCQWYGKTLIKIGRFEPSSKTCSECGYIKQDLTLADREWSCEGCNTVHDRDLNAAKNIKAFGLKQYSPEGIRVEPVERPAMKGRKEAGKVSLNN
jgi:putative transposase